MPLVDTTTLIAYLAAAAVLVLIPGPGTAWIVAQTFAGGMARGVQAAFGLETATLIHAMAAGLGLSALLATSALAFEILKYAGAAYLVWLGIKAWHGSGADDAGALHASDPRTGVGLREVYWRSVMTGVLNPKVAVFFLAFLPQFVKPERGMVLLQFIMLGVLLSMIGMCHSLVLAFAIGRLGKRLSGGRRLARWRQRAVGALFVGLGLRLALQGRT